MLEANSFTSMIDDSYSKLIDLQQLISSYAVSFKWSHRLLWHLDWIYERQQFWQNLDFVWLIIIHVYPQDCTVSEIIKTIFPKVAFIRMTLVPWDRWHFMRSLGDHFNQGGSSGSGEAKYIIITQWSHFYSFYMLS